VDCLRTLPNAEISAQATVIDKIFRLKKNQR
jgi:hypothetical protein